MTELPPEVRRLYDGLWDGSSWQDGLDEICAAFRAHHIIAVNRAASESEGAAPLCWSAHVTPEHQQSVAREAGTLLQIAAQMRVGTAMDTAEILPDRELVKSRVYRKVIRPIGGRYGITASPFAGSLIAVCRPPAAQRFTASEICHLQAILPHLETVLRLKRQLVEPQAQAACLEAALDAIGIGVLIATSSGRALYTNPEADAALRSIESAGRHATPAARLRDAIGRRDGRPAAIPCGPSRRPVIVRAVPLSGRGDRPLCPPAEGRVAVFLRDLDRREHKPCAALLASLGLTPREASLAELLARDMTLAEAAAALRITRENARTHLKRIFSKTETRRQAELVSLILRSMP
ncbi:MAG: helix-turn-helix transcriptional regulator [Acidisphaera sp.]|nr:helix-turn-helix transcriptional regulator [Acidisphaera sp.]